MYTIPDRFFFRLHHVRPRFKTDIENVLIYIATAISGISALSKDQFAAEVNRAIRRFPGNLTKNTKTIDNWRTEISALFGFIEHDNLKKIDKPSFLVHMLAKEQDLPQFFKYFLYLFQYPGGHLKPAESLKMIKTGIHFKPARYILKLLKTGEKQTINRFYITKDEATHCIFNDLRVTRDGRNVKDTILLMLDNRKNKVKYNSKGDVIRYAGDILDYMVIANILVKHANKYFLNTQEKSIIDKFIEDKSFFTPYNTLYAKRNLNINQIKAVQDKWFQYVNTDLGDNFFKTDVRKFIGISETDYHESINVSLQRFFQENREIKTKEIGDTGENLVLGHECMKMKLAGKKDLIHLIKKIPDSFAMGYDILSCEIDEQKRYIEVKTTISLSRINANNFLMSTNEWLTAETNGDTYFIYRLIINKESIRLLIIQNPVEKYKHNELRMIPRKGAEIILNENSSIKEELLIWKD
ncbi:MAG TPA: DUF3883 domain-containing protein [Ignavibacteria bacterium]|nr:restriction endonuclease [Bacteroidota bacterium]HRE09996.1 DUF3883 domain-containing protein [Ignavibacteria bacterium]HRF66937.1 DUF3883 domain-containing protein [Ignavibacteria bacterium]HRJ85495.1 DUF3883 domain-containing protein [Ignavibacteria bacterium]